VEKEQSSPRQLTIRRLQEFLQDSVNLEPELEQFVKTLLYFLESAAQYEVDSPDKLRAIFQTQSKLNN
jgi:hypothetical protein